VVKSTYAGAKAWLGFGEAASTSSKVTRAALISTGIGILIVAIGLLAANFDKVKEVGASIAAKFKPEFTAIGEFIDVVLAKGRDLASLFTFGLIDNAAKHAQAVAEDAARKRYALEADQTARLIDILKARGEDTLALEVGNAANRLASLKRSTADERKAYEDAARDLAVLRAQFRKRADDEEKATRLAHLTALATIQQAKGAESFAQQLAVKQEQLAQLLAADRVNQAAVLQAEADIDALRLAHAKEQADKRAALQSATLQAQLVRLQASTSEQSLVEVAANAKQIELAKQHRNTLLAQAQVDKAALVAADADLYRLRLERSRIFYREEAEQAQAPRTAYAKAIEAIRAKDVEQEKQYQDGLNRMQAAGARVTQRVADELAAELQLKAMKASADADIFGNLLIKVFGLTDAQAQSLKGRIAEIGAQVSGLVGAMLQGATSEADAALTAAQTRLAELDQQLSEATQRRQSDEAALQESSGARRDFLLTRIAKEQAAEQKLATEKAKAAKEEQQAAQKRAQLEKEQQRLTAIGTTVTNAATAAVAIKAGVEAVHGANKLPFPANIAALVVALAATGAAVASAKGLANTFADGTGALGSDGVLRGPAHSKGGIGLFNRYGHFYGEAEGGEAITPVDASRRNGPLLEVLRTKGRTRQLTLADFVEISGTRTLPPPTTHYAAGGTLGSAAGVGAAGSTAGQGQVVIATADLSELVATNRAMLSHLQSIGAATAQTAAFGPPVLAFGHEAEQKRRELAQGMDQAESFATLGG
jgi:hypothetical protein